MSNSICNIIFDFGGVIYDINQARVTAEFKKLGMDNFEQIYSLSAQSPIFQRLETDDTSPQDFVAEIHALLNGNTADVNIIQAWNSMLAGFNLKRIELLKQLKKQYNIFLLSNTNRIHYAHFMGQFQELTGWQNFDDLFEKAYFSFDIKLRKPDPQAYLYVLQDAGLIARESLFIDDSIENIQAAKNLGIGTYHLGEGEEMLNLFDRKGLKKQLLI